MTQKLKVLIVEDEMILASDIRMQLQNEGYNVVGIAKNGEKAINLTKERNPDIILMDIAIKGEIDGVETAEEIHKFYDVPIVYITAYFDDKTLNRAIKTEPYGYIIKPFQDGQIHCTIVLAIYKYQQEQALKDFYKQ